MIFILPGSVTLAAVLIAATIISIKSKTFQVPSYQKYCFETKETASKQFSLYARNPLGLTKYEIELALTGLLIMVFLGVTVFFGWMADVLIKDYDDFKNIFLIAYGCLFYLLVMSLALRSFYFSFRLSRRFRKQDVFLAAVGKRSVDLPVICIEGIWRDICEALGTNSLCIPLVEILQWSVEPSRGFHQVSNSYYKIQLENQKEPVYINRSLFYGQERSFLAQIAPSLQTKIQYNDNIV